MTKREVRKLLRAKTELRAVAVELELPEKVAQWDRDIANLLSLL